MLTNKIILHAELGQGVRPVGKPEQSFRSCLKNVKKEFVVTVRIGTHREQSYTYIGRKSAMKQWLISEASKSTI
jgi:hypothetical protein